MRLGSLPMHFELHPWIRELLGPGEICPRGFEVAVEADGFAQLRAWLDQGFGQVQATRLPGGSEAPQVFEDYSSARAD